MLRRPKKDRSIPPHKYKELFPMAMTTTVTEEKIRMLELLHQKYDLLHNFVRLFGLPERRSEDKELIRGKKKRISQELADTLREEKLSRRRCSCCGRILPFSYPYGMCRGCHEEMVRRRKRCGESPEDFFLGY